MHARWWFKVFSSGINQLKVVHRPDKENVATNALFRNPVDDVITTETDVMVSNADSIKRVSDVSFICIQAVKGDFHGEQRKLQ